VDTTLNAATLTNTGTIDIQNDYAIDPGAGSPILNNNNGGVIRRSVSSGLADINFTVNNAVGATIETQSGALALNGGGIVRGAYSMFPATFLRLGGGTFTMSGNPTVTGGGLLSINGGTLDAGAGVDVTYPNLHDHRRRRGARERRFHLVWRHDRRQRAEGAEQHVGPDLRL
jgi:hypothetical protein